MSTTQDNVKQVENAIFKDHGLHIRVVAEIVGIDKESVRRILHDNLNVKKVC